MDPNLRNGYAQSYFLGVQHQLTGNLALEVNTLGALGRRLITTDIVNREFSTTTGTGRFNEALPDVAWRSGQGSSNYNALTALARYRGVVGAVPGGLHLEPFHRQPERSPGRRLLRPELHPASARPAGRARSRRSPSSSTAAPIAGIRISTSVRTWFYCRSWICRPPRDARWVRALTRDWHFSQLAAFRSGFPYTVLAPSTAYLGSGEISNSGPIWYPTCRIPAPWSTGGRLLLKPGKLLHSGRRTTRQYRTQRLSGDPALQHRYFP